ncbi:MAG: repeat-containing protein [Myxococcales bacterium]|nr:repeat-containing protein [Myxococcales bacterium]
MRAVMLRSGFGFAVAWLALSLAWSHDAGAATTPRLDAMPTTGTAPLMVTFDTSHTVADAALVHHLLFLGNGDAQPLATAAEMASYGYPLPGFYLAQTWLRTADGFGASLPVAISAARVRDGQSPPSLTLVVARTTDPLTMAFMGTVTRADGDPLAAQRWDFGDGSFSGEAQPFHTYARAGIYQATLLATSHAGMAAWGRSVVAVADANGALGASLLATVTPEDATAFTPVRVSAYVEGAGDAKLMSAEVAWPDLDDAAPVVTPTATGLVISSDHGFAEAGYYDVPISVLLVGQSSPMTVVAHVTVANLDGTPPSPVLLMAPSAEATAGVAYEPNGAAALSRALAVGGNGPFAFGAASPPSVGMTVDDAGRVSWTPSRSQLGRTRLAVRITDADGQEAVREWVVETSAQKRGGCEIAGSGDEAAGSALFVALLLLAAFARRRSKA